MPNAMLGPRNPTRQSPSAIKRRDISPSSSHSSSISRHSPQRSEPLSPDGAFSSAHQYVTNPPAPGGTSSIRRREANRLAAQRFRSRKKGYQDSLEERIRVLESEKEVLIRQVDESLSRSGHPSLTSLQPRSSNLRQGQADGDGVDGHHWSSKGHSSSSHRSTSPERREPPLDAEVRIASLESANRRLQDDVRNLVEENDQLRDELQRWRSWHEEHDRSRRMDMADGHHSRRPHRKGLVDGDSSDRSRRNDMMDGDHADGSPHGDRVDGHIPLGHHAHLDGDHPRPNLPSLDRSLAYPSTSSSSSFGSTPQGSRSDSFPRSNHSDGSALQLAPLRLPPIRSAPISLQDFRSSSRDLQPHMDGNR